VFVSAAIGADLHRAVLATAPGEKLLIKGATCEEFGLLYYIKLVFVQKITFVLEKIDKNCCHDVCTKSFVGWAFASEPTGELAVLP